VLAATSTRSVVLLLVVLLPMGLGMLLARTTPTLSFLIIHLRLLYLN